MWESRHLATSLPWTNVKIHLPKKPKIMNTDINIEPEKAELNQKPSDEVRCNSCSTWEVIDSCPPHTTVIVGDVKKTGSGYHNGFGQWFAYGSSTPIETPTHWMPYPKPPKI